MSLKWSVRPRVRASWSSLLFGRRQCLAIVQRAQTSNFAKYQSEMPLLRSVAQTNAPSCSPPRAASDHLVRRIRFRSDHVGGLGEQTVCFCTVYFLILFISSSLALIVSVEDRHQKHSTIDYAANSIRPIRCKYRVVPILSQKVTLFIYLCTVKNRTRSIYVK